MTLTARIALAYKLGYWEECRGLGDALLGQVDAPFLTAQTAYRQGYEDGMAILMKGEGR